MSRPRIHSDLTAGSVPQSNRSLFRTGCLGAALALATALAPSAWAENIAPLGTGIMGVNNAVDTDLGTLRFNSGVAANINDGSLSTRVDNWFGSAPTDLGQNVSFVGVRWAAQRHDTISTLTLTMATFGDGGWFGVPNALPPAGGALAVTNLIEPTVQVTTNGGITWVTVPSTSDYIAVMTGHQIGGTGGQPNPSSKTSTFTLVTPAAHINGIRIIGTNGGRAGADANGFIGVFDLAIEAAPFADTDGDGMSDDWETAFGLVVGADDSLADLDFDGLSNLGEHSAGSNPNTFDTDNDGLADGDEVGTYLTNPLYADSDLDGLGDGDEANNYFTDPLVADSDQDGVSDGAEVNTYQSDPLDRDTDDDGFTDGREVALGSNPTNPNNFPDNVALIGTAIMGVKDSITSGPDIPYSQQAETVRANINDGILTTRVDTYNGATLTTASYVGIVWSNLVAAPILNLDLTMATFVDGGWFGVNNLGPGGGGALTAAHLTEPVVQVSVNGGVDWINVAFSSDYTNKLTGHRIGGGGLPNPTSVTIRFTLATAATNINAIRIIGSEGGTASRGFIGVFELAVRTEISDSDNDGMSDSWETQNGLIVGTNDSAGDADNDGLNNLQEFVRETNPQVADTDGDGLQDGPEVTVHNTNPTREDTDSDGLSDGSEVTTHQTNPLVKDTDGDGFGDGVEVGQGSSPTDPQSFPSNYALLGTGLIGTKESVETGVDVPYANAGAPQNVNDGILTTRVDTWNGGTVGTASYVGVRWNQPVANPVTSLTLSMAVFFDGGWFGVNNIGPGTGGSLSAATHLLEPVVQVTTDGGATWTTVPHTSDYLTAVNNHPLPTVDFGPPTLATATFTLTTPQSAINGIRLLGSEGGTASGGFLGVFELAVTVSPGNSCPTVSSANVTLAEDTLAPVVLSAADVNGDALVYTITSHPSHGTLSGTAPNLTYTPAQNYCGPDSFTFKVSDGECESSEATVQLTVTCVNDLPTARITVSPAVTFDGVPNKVVISANNSNACISLDGTLSSDVEPGELTYAWTLDGAPTPFATGPVAGECLELGVHSITLTVADADGGEGFATEIVEVISAGEAVELLVNEVNDANIDRKNKRPFIATLKAAIASFDRGNNEAAIGQLGAFQNKVRAQLGTTHPALAADWISIAQTIADAAAE